MSAHWHEVTDEIVPCPVTGCFWNEPEISGARLAVQMGYGCSDPEFPDGYQGAGPMYAAVPGTPGAWMPLAVAGETTYVVEPPYPREAHAAYGGSSVFLDKAAAEQIADARDGTYVRWDGLAAYCEMTPAAEAAEERRLNCGPEAGS